VYRGRLFIARKTACRFGYSRTIDTVNQSGRQLGTDIIADGYAIGYTEDGSTVKIRDLEYGFDIVI
jgi:hypothetical protein